MLFFEKGNLHLPHRDLHSGQLTHSGWRTRAHTVQDAPLHHPQCSSVAVHRHLGARGISCTELHRAPRCRRTSLHLPASAPTVREGCTESWHRRYSVSKCCMPCFVSYLLLYLINRYLALNDAFLYKSRVLPQIFSTVYNLADRFYETDQGDRSYLKSGAGNSASITTSPWHQKKPSRRRRSGALASS